MPSPPIPITIPAPPAVRALLDRLHTLSENQENDPSFNMRANPADSEAFKLAVADKFIALDRDKAAFMFALVRATDAKGIVEAGTSYGVSTIYLALAAAMNGPGAVVVGTEHEATKAAQAQGYFAEAGVAGVVDLRVGDLRETLMADMPVVDFLLLDIWTPMALPALKLCEPHFRPGAVILCDNTITSKNGYRGLFAYVDQAGTYERITIPYDGGLEMITFHPKK